MTATSVGSRKTVFKKWAVRIIVIASLMWTVANWSALTEIKDELDEAIIFVILFAFSEVCFIVGALLVAVGTGKTIFADTGKNPLNRLRAILRVRSTYRKFVADAPRSGAVRFGFHLNWFGALATGVFAAVGIIVVLPMTSWGLLVLPLLDIVATIGWRAPIQKRLGHTSGYRVRLAQKQDIPAIAALDTSRYEDITPVYADDPTAMFEARLANAPKWFYVMEDVDGTIVGILSTAPTTKSPDQFVSWNDSTANGTLEGVVEPKGKWLYVTALTTSEEVGRNGEEDRLIAYGLGATIRRGIGVAYFSGRMPGYHYHSEMSPRQYYDAKDPDNPKLALDKQIRLYEGWGMKRIRLVKDGFAADWKSAGYGVLFRYDLPFAHRPQCWLAGSFLQLAVNRPWLWRLVKPLL